MSRGVKQAFATAGKTNENPVVAGLCGGDVPRLLVRKLHVRRTIEVLLFEPLLPGVFMQVTNLKELISNIEDLLLQYEEHLGSVTAHPRSLKADPVDNQVAINQASGRIQSRIDWLKRIRDEGHELLKVPID